MCRITKPVVWVLSHDRPGLVWVPPGLELSDRLDLDAFEHEVLYEGWEAAAGPDDGGREGRIRGWEAGGLHALRVGRDVDVRAPGGSMVAGWG